ncbi:MAG TPA: four helix bundle protein [Niabella sp.]|nr:four helix bundle protein [Niabella sp.]
MEVCEDIYLISKELPKEELYGLISQLKRSAVSIAANISEGAGRNSDNEFLHFLGVANASSFELQTHIIIANRVGLLNDEIKESFLEKLDEIQKMSYGLQSLLKNKKINLYNLKSKV